MDKKFQLIRKLGFINPPEHYKKLISDPGFLRGEFTNGVELPAELLELLNKKGFEYADDEYMAMLFSSDFGVCMHEDEQPSVIWVIEAPVQKTTELIIEHRHVQMVRGDVWLCDTRRKHGVIHADNRHRLWGVLSAYVQRLKA